MRRIAFLLIIIAFISCSRNDKNDFGKHFLDKTLRINLVHSGDACDESFKLEQIYDDGLWYGRTKNLVNPYRLGTYLYEVRDVETDELLYSDGISTLTVTKDQQKILTDSAPVTLRFALAERLTGML